ncbi:DNA-binding CsgD family transcriptional regulator/tetratricopeptide (TPR) repeat protein [Microbacteriaceae bacterium SG_E_30_P1]|uniref:DNA-binding CsgD family transcriptional regulator/tetratricopeptide (TPR) repeat protein n=1 Tax=Antiquaquibacter oligotrophicus TaxID=2880260 RepID=A0ABT6KJ27_9MICO|nr:LuxR family transcriptional regulator [Antiquaquibacter oligotrophicus]MDH6179881.1 DNA-binding CsgD family transcriptional regulator/tetratricopeptide (TPR) repeat protein [Antiquaquibacter oligotrophicus]UDF14358.1 LuxR C-terminal-related transcriptional regulator [Antiquaquibacter oligotrophicus]
MTRSVPTGTRAADGRWPLVGREQLVDRLCRWFAGDGARLCVLYGSSGVGKSRLAFETASRLSGEGWASLPVSASTIMATVPLGALTPLFSSDREALDAVASDPGALFRRATEAVRDAAAGRRTVLVVDDLSLLDPLSATLIAQLVASGYVRLLATARDREPLPDPIMALWSSDSALRVDVPPLSVGDYELVLREVLGGPVAHRSAVELHQSTAGNPLVLRELTMGALEVDRLVEHAGVWQLVGEPVGTPALRDLILSRLRHLDDAERDVVERLAVCGELQIDHLTSDGAREAVIRLESAGIMTLVEGPRGLVGRLVHPQYAGAVVDSLSRLRVSDVLLQQADLLEAERSGASDDLRVVVWRLEAGKATDPELLASAARLARQASDHPTVERLAAAAIRVAGGRPDLLLLRGEALLRMGRAEDALEVLAEARMEDAPGELRSAIAATTAIAHASVRDGLDAGLEVIDAAEEGLSSPDVGLVLTRALIELYQDRAIEVDALLAELDASLGSSPAERAIVASTRSLSHAALGRTDEALRDARLALDFARSTSGAGIPGLSVAMGLGTLATVQLHVGDPDGALRSATSALLESLVADDEIVARSHEFLLARIEWERGNLDAAERWYRDTMSGALSMGPISLHVPAACGLAMTLAMRGDLAGARDALAIVPDQADHVPGAVIARAWVSALSGDAQTARNALLAGAERFGQPGHRFLEAVFLFHLARLGFAADAAPRLASLAELTGSPFFDRQARHAAAEASGDRRALVDVAEEWAASGARLFAAEAFASAARAARRAEDHRLAVSLQSAADEHARACGGASTPLLQFTEELTPLTRREREIGALAARGLSSKQIADTLFLSTRTVDNHLQSIYGKLGIRGRHELQSSGLG